MCTRIQETYTCRCIQGCGTLAGPNDTTIKSSFVSAVSSTYMAISVTHMAISGMYMAISVMHMASTLCRTPAELRRPKPVLLCKSITQKWLLLQVWIQHWDLRLGRSKDGLAQFGQFPATTKWTSLRLGLCPWPQHMSKGDLGLVHPAATTPAEPMVGWLGLGHLDGLGIGHPTPSTIWQLQYDIGIIFQFLYTLHWMSNASS